MNFNISAYMIYLAITIFIIVFVGKYFYRNGRIFILALYNGNTDLTDNLNRILLIAYYLFNIGYAFIKLNHWQKLINIEMLISSISINMGELILILAFTHYINMLGIFYLSKNSSLSITNKSFQS
jgi:hypothetical protein